MLPLQIFGLWLYIVKKRISRGTEEGGLMPVKIEKLTSLIVCYKNHMYNKTKPGMYVCNPINLRCTPQECQHLKKKKKKSVCLSVFSEICLSVCFQ